MCGHCTCMAGLGEVCSHIAAVLFSIETAVREGLTNISNFLTLFLECFKNKQAAIMEKIKYTGEASYKTKFNYKKPKRFTSKTFGKYIDL